MSYGSTAPKWNDELVFKIYDYARAGLKKSQIAAAIGVTRITFRRWLETKPLVALAIKRGKVGSKEAKEAATNYRDYVYARLPERLQELWNKIDAAGKAKNGSDMIERMLANQGKDSRQRLFLYALVAYNFSLTHACMAVNINKGVYNAWMRNDPEFADLVDEMEIAKKDFFEATLVEAAKSGDTAAIIFANKTLNADRGYNPAQKVEIGGSLNVNVSVQPMSKLNLPISTMKEVLAAVRQAQPKIDDSDVIDMPLLPSIPTVDQEVF